MPPDFDLSDPDAVGYCPACGYGYTARASRCKSCDVALISRAEAEAARRKAEPSPPDWTDVETEEETEETSLLGASRWKMGSSRPTS